MLVMLLKLRVLDDMVDVFRLPPLDCTLVIYISFNLVFIFTFFLWS